MSEDPKIEACAEAAHEMNLLWCRLHGDDTQMHWNDAPEWQRESAIKGVRGAIAGNTPKESHESWLKDKIEGGWTYGEVKDEAKKQHPCFVPYERLPPIQKAKDFVFVNTVNTFWAALNGA